MWSGESAWCRRREGVEHTEASELAGPAYYAVVAEQVRLLGDVVQEFLDGHVEMEEYERDHAIREGIVRPVVQEDNRKAEMAGDPLLPDGAVRDIFSRLRRSHGVLASLFENPGVTDIHFNGPGKMVWVKRNGRLEPLDLPLTKAEIDGYIEEWQVGGDHALTPLNWGVDIRQQNARISAVHERVALDGPAVSIRLRSPAPLESAELYERGMMPAVVWRCLEALFVHGRVNLVIGGPMGSGKTTLMQALLRALGETCRIVTIEGPRELELGPHALLLETHLPQDSDPERKGEVTARELVQRRAQPAHGCRAHGHGRVSRARSPRYARRDELGPRWQHHDGACRHARRDPRPAGTPVHARPGAHPARGDPRDHERRPIPGPRSRRLPTP